MTSWDPPFTNTSSVIASLPATHVTEEILMPNTTNVDGTYADARLPVSWEEPRMAGHTLSAITLPQQGCTAHTGHQHRWRPQRRPRLGYQNR